MPTRKSRPSPPAVFDGGFPFSAVFRALEKAASAWRAPSLQGVAAQAGEPFHVLTGTLLSLRTRDVTTLAAWRRLSALAATPEELAARSESEISEAIYPVAFFRVKARNLKALARILCERHGGAVPGEMDALLALPGVGRKTANLTLSLGFGRPAICVDVHVHRILNRLGVLGSSTPEATEGLLREHLPRRRWSAVNRVLVPFGQTVCTPLSPRCSACPVGQHCRRCGVTRSR